MQITITFLNKMLGIKIFFIIKCFEEGVIHPVYAQLFVGQN